MKSFTREILSGGAAVATLAGVTVTTALPLAGSVLASGLVYAGCRLLLPSEAEVGTAKAGNGIGAQLLEKSQHAVGILDSQTERLDEPQLKRDVAQLCDVLQQILKRGSHRTRAIQIDSEFPRRIQELAKLLEKYVAVAENEELSDQVSQALAHTEQVFSRTLERFTDLLRREIDAEAVDLKVDARVYEEMLSIQCDLEQAKANE